MKKITVLIPLTVLLTGIILSAGCSHWHESDRLTRFEKINARVLVYMPEKFLSYKSDHPAAVKTVYFRFNEPIKKFLPAFFNDTFTSADFTETKADEQSAYDFLVIPVFEDVFFHSDRTFGHELRVTVSMSFTSGADSEPFVLKGKGRAQDLYRSRAFYEEDLAEQAFEDALNDLRIKIQNHRSQFEKPEQ